MILIDTVLFTIAFTAVDGGFSKWTPFSACSVTCGSGAKVRTRTCTNPPRQWKGKDCVGPRQEPMACNEGPCKWYTNPWSQNKLGGKAIIGKAACMSARWTRVGTRGLLSVFLNLFETKLCDFPHPIIQTKKISIILVPVPKRTNTHPISHPRR